MKKFFIMCQVNARDRNELSLKKKMIGITRNDLYMQKLKAFVARDLSVRSQIKGRKKFRFSHTGGFYMSVCNVSIINTASMSGGEGGGILGER